MILADEERWYLWVKQKGCRLKTMCNFFYLCISAGVVCGAIKNDSVYSDATLSDGACAVVAGILFHNLTVLGKN